MQPVAILMSARGPLHIFSDSAVAAIIDKLPTLMDTLASGSVASSVPTQCCSSSTPPTSTSTQKTKLLDSNDGALYDFSISEWAAYARRKARIASSMCTANGMLKMQLRDLIASGGGRPSALRVARGDGLGAVENENDLLQSSDPWLNAKYDKPVTTGQRSDAWSSWTPSSRAPAVVEDFAAKGSCQPIGASPVATECPSEGSDTARERWAVLVRRQRRFHMQLHIINEKLKDVSENLLHSTPACSETAGQTEDEKQKTKKYVYVHVCMYIIYPCAI